MRRREVETMAGMPLEASANKSRPMVRGAVTSVFLFAFFAAAPSSRVAGQTAPQPQRLSSDSQQPGTSIKILTREVVVDVVVTDGKGRPVTGLTQKDFEVYDDGQPQRTTSFTPHKPVSIDLPAPPPLPKLPPNTFVNYSATAEDAPLNVILIDAGDTAMQDIPYVRQQISKFLQERPPDARYAVVAIGAGSLSMLQGFTSETDLLLKAINSKAMTTLLFQPTANPFTVRGGTPSLAQGSETRLMIGSGPVLPPDVVSRPCPPDADTCVAQNRFYAHSQVRAFADEMKELSTFLEGLPGRKTLLWFTGSFPLNILPTPLPPQPPPIILSAGGHPTEEAAQEAAILANEQARNETLARRDLDVHNQSLVKQVAELLERSRTAVYAIDAQGLVAFVPDKPPSPGILPDPTQMMSPITDLNSGFATLDVVAKETGGEAFINTNGLKEAMTTAVVEGSSYYTLTYSPANVQFNGALRHIRVELRDYHARDRLAYRHSYYANSYDAAREVTPDPFAFTLQHGSPDLQQLLFKVSLQPVGEPQPAKPSEIALLTLSGKDGSKKKRKSVEPARPVMIQTYAAEYIFLTHAILAAGGEAGKRHVNLQFAVRAFDRNGITLRTSTRTIQGDISPQVYEQAIAEGSFHVDLKFAVPVASAYLRMAVRDAEANRIGSFEIPLPLQPVASNVNPSPASAE